MPGNRGADLRSRNASVLGLSWSTDGKAFLSRSVGGSNGGSVLLLQGFVEEGAAHFVSTRPIPTGEQRVWNAVLLPDASSVVVVIEARRIVSRIEIESGARMDLFEAPALKDVSALAVASDGSCLAFALDGDVQLCDPLSGEELLRLPGHDSSVTDMIFSDDDRWISAGYGDGTIRVWNRTTGEVAHDLARHETPVAGVRFVNGKRCLASVGVQGDDTLRLWDLESGELLWQVSANQGGVHALAITPDGRLAATGGGGDNEIVFWDLNERIHLRCCTGHIGMIRALQFSPDGTTLTSASSDGTICVWDVDSTELLSSIDVGAITYPAR